MYGKRIDRDVDSAKLTQLLMTDNYLPGAMVLGHSLKDNGTQKQLVALVTLDTVSAATIDELKVRSVRGSETISDIL